MAAVDEVVEGVGGSRLAIPLLDLAEAHVIEHEQFGAGPGLASRAIAQAGLRIPLSQEPGAGPDIRH